MVVQRANSAFTLVELLVVISIIALLLAILMPALNRAREQGRTIVCASRLHQIGLACQLYLYKYNNNFFPSYCGDQAWASEPQGHELQTLAGTKVGFYPGSIYDCPSQPSRLRPPTLVDWAKYLDYSYNACLGDGDLNSPMFPPPKAKIRQASRVVMFWDSTRYRGYYCRTKYGNGTPNPEYWNNKNSGWFNPTPALMTWPHSKSANFVFVDNHIERANEKTVTDNWFYPGF
jgi:prepilin-type N-terminal cleavage/methylation domain-containing protein/prepilin-type processing-associated H-X9-DG protein